MDDDQNDLFGELSPPVIKRPSRVKQRLLDSAIAITEDEDPKSLLFLHSVFCQVGLPYRDPGDDVREWQRRQGIVALQLSAGEAYHPKSGQWLKLGLPFGPKPRLILAHLNAEALRADSPVVEIGNSLTGFVERIRGFKGGRELRAFKSQLSRLSAALLRMAIIRNDLAVQIDAKVVTGFDLWFPKDERQRVLWPSTVRLSHEYFESLKKHAVPLDERALAALAHSALALDCYAWLAQRLCRIRPKRRQFVPWSALKDQFGFGYGRMIDFKRKFRETLGEVHSQYRGAKFELDDRGMTLFYSLPPIHGRCLEIIKDD
jgi:hypothetical protein